MTEPTLPDGYVVVNPTAAAHVEHIEHYTRDLHRFLALLPAVNKHCANEGADPSVAQIEPDIPEGYSFQDFHEVMCESAELDAGLAWFLAGRHPLPEGVRHQPLFLRRLH
jgi:hypothetical protein